MEVTRIMIKDGYIDEASEIANNYLKDISDELKNNPQFLAALSDELRFLASKRRLNDSVPMLELYVGDDGKSFEIREGIRPNPDCANDILQNNINFRRVTFNLDEQSNMEIIRNDGTFYQFDDYKKATDNSKDLQNKFNRLTSQDTPTVISVYHKHRLFMPNGIQVEESTYSDAYPLSCHYNDKRELVNQTLIHSPRDWNFNVMPTSPQWEFNPFVFKAYRYNQVLGQVEVQTRYGDERNAKRSYAIYPAGTEYPEKLTTNPTPIMQYEENNMVVTPDYQNQFEGMNRMDIERELMKSFYRGINGSRTKESNPEICASLEESVRNSLEQRYGVDTSELISGINR